MIDICTNCPLDDCDDTDARCGWRLYQQAERRRKASSRRQLQARRANIAIARHHRVEQAKLGFKKYDQRKRYAKRREVRAERIAALKAELAELEGQNE